MIDKACGIIQSIKILNMNNIGRRLRYFREQRRVSQMDVELAIDAAFGSISRMESGKVNPTKETVEKIAKFLKLTDAELDYIIGPTSIPATLEESTNAINTISSYFNENGSIGYLIDDRFRLLMLTKTTKSALGLSEKQYSEVIGKTLIELILKPEYNLNQFISDKNHYNLRQLILRFICEMSHMFDDEYYILQKSLILNDQFGQEIWEELLKLKRPDIYKYSDRNVQISIKGINIELHYSDVPLSKFKRFTVVEYLPDNNLTKLLSHLI